ncbi:MAG: hydroxyisourate hydrolase [Pseudomonadota bacterium]
MIELTLSSHVLDLDRGQPAAGLNINVYTRAGDVRTLLYSAATDDDGRIDKRAVQLDAGEALELTFATGAWYAARGDACFYPEVVITANAASAGHYHIPLLINRHGYSTYRGS